MMEEEREKDRYLSLRMKPITDDAILLAERVASDTWGATKSRRKPSSQYLAATGALLADLLKAAATGGEASCFRTMGRSSFTGDFIGYRPFKRLTVGAETAKLITVKEGTGGGTLVGEATRFKATSVLLKLAGSYGVDPANWQNHFRSIPRPSKIAEPLVLKSSSRLVGNRKIDGIRMPFDPSNPKVIALVRQVDDINAFFAAITIEPDSEHYAFQRIFNQGDLPAFDWNKGGRLYSMGDGYQLRKAPDRAKMKLNGEPVVEIDIQASHLTIMHAKLGKHFELTKGDPYAHPTIPRSVLKGWVVMTLGHDKFHRAWSPDMKAEYRKSTGRDLGKDYPIKMVREEALKLLPLLDGWPSCPIRWGDLQYIESCAVIDTVHQLAMEHNVPALPVHDSIIVPKSKSGLASAVLVENFTNYVGVEPILCIK